MKIKTISVLVTACIAFSFTNSYQDECKPYFPMKKGTTWVYNEYDKKGELAGTNTTIVNEIVENGNKIEYRLTGIHDGPKKKEKNHMEQDILYVCEDGVFKMSMENLVPQETMDSFGDDATIEVDQTEMEFPSTLSPGDELKDASVQVSISMNGMNVMKINVNITNRKIEKMDEVTTDAGTYNCALMTYDVTTKMAFSTIESSVKDWISPVVGIVKSESYDKKGELSNSRALVSYKPGE
ncbi:MAG: hypothetical protein HUJ25_08610 [Crocinitomicaceae bacterium]|nr:hypothetical protein [Crocinitomicaceae bacterium]